MCQLTYARWYRFDIRVVWNSLVGNNIFYPKLFNNWIQFIGKRSINRRRHSGLEKLIITIFRRHNLITKQLS